jgi:hypothetical protein
MVPRRLFIAPFVCRGGPPFVHHGLYTLICSSVVVPSFVCCSPPHSLHMLFIHRGGPPFIHHWLSPIIHSSWFPSFIVGGPPSFVVGCPPSCVRRGPSRLLWVVPHSFHGDVASSTCNPPCEQWLAAVGAGAGFCRWWGAIALLFVPLISPPLVGVHLRGVVTRPLAPMNHPVSSGSQAWGWVLGCRSAGGGLVGGWWLWMVTWRGLHCG